MKAKKLLLIRKSTSQRKIGGREMLSETNERVLQSLFLGHFFKYEIIESSISVLSKFLAAVRGRVDGVDNKVLVHISNLVQLRAIDLVFLDGSNLGPIAKHLKSNFPNLEIITYCHNVETRFFLGLLRRTKSFKSLAVLLGNYLAERDATRFSDKIICLNERDRGVLRKIFGREATHVSHIALDRPVIDSRRVGTMVPKKQFILFVGGNFYANLAGIEWFRNFVSPYIDLPLYVVGRGFEQEAARLEVPGKIAVVGAVDNLEEWYRRSRFVIAPIFDGSGMKTKVAEALMNGRKIVGTPEAFTGYEEFLPAAGWCCSTAEEFIDACNAARREASCTADKALIDIFENNYSSPAARRRFSEILSIN